MARVPWVEISCEIVTCAARSRPSARTSSPVSVPFLAYEVAQAETAIKRTGLHPGGYRTIRGPFRLGQAELVCRGIWSPEKTEGE